MFLSAKYFMQISDIDNLVDNLEILFFDNLPIISEMPIYRLSIIFFDIIAHPYPLATTSAKTLENC